MAKQFILKIRKVSKFLYLYLFIFTGCQNENKNMFTDVICVELNVNKNNEYTLVDLDFFPTVF